MTATACTVDTATIMLTQDVDGALNADLIVSTVDGNGITVQPDGVAVLLRQGGKAYRTSNQATSDTVEENVQFTNTRSHSLAGMHDNATHNERLVATVEGWYAMVGQLTFANDPTGVRRGRIVNQAGTVLASQNCNPVSGSGGEDINLAAMAYMGVGDYITLKAFQSSGGGLDIVSNDQGPSLAMFLQ